jgi:pilus assembly protein CpaC
VIRLAVDPEVSTIDTSLGTVLVPGGSPVPGLNTRRVHTVVEMREGQTLAIAGLLQVTLDAQTQRIPGLGDLPVLGPFFSNTTNTRVEKELIVLVTPHLIDPMNCDQLPPIPGDGVVTPSDFEFYFLNRIEGRTGRDWRSTTQYEKRLPVVRNLLRLDAAHVVGPHGFCE